MVDFLDLAKLLEDAAKAIRKLHEMLPQTRRSMPWKDFKNLISFRCRKAICKAYRSKFGDSPPQTIDDVCRLTEEDLRDEPNVGIVTVEEIRQALSKHGLALKGE